jgi:hypothetical protein
VLDLAGPQMSCGRRQWLFWTTQTGYPSPVSGKCLTLNPRREIDRLREGAIEGSKEGNGQRIAAANIA